MADQVTDAALQDTETKLLRDIEVDAYLVDCVKLDPIALDEEFIRLPGDLAYWNEKYAQAIRAHLHAKHDADKTRAAVMLEIREEAASTGVKMTVADVDARVTIDERVSEADIALVEAEAAMKHARVRCEAVMAKRDMLQSLGAKIRAEMSDPVVREQFAGRRLSERR
jgi:hypothetical protein